MLLITGNDAKTFIERQASNNLKNKYVAFLSPQAKIISLAYLDETESGIELYANNEEELKNHLEKFAIIEDINFEISDKQADAELDSFQPGESIIQLNQNNSEKKIFEKYIDFDKGCYPGQEPVSKFKNLGMRKREERAQEYLDEALQIFAAAPGPQDLDPAIELLRKALKENPKFEDAYESLGVMLAKQEKFKEAIAVMHQLEMINPQNIMAQTNLSIFYMRIGDKETAEEHKAKSTVLQFDAALAKQD